MKSMAEVKKKKTQVCRWCFTLNNPTNDELNKMLLKFTTPEEYGKEINGYHPTNNSQVKYVIWQYEIGESGTPHFQGYVHFTRSKLMKSVKIFFEIDRMHLEPARGTLDENITYCSKNTDIGKDGKEFQARVDPNALPWEFGDPNKCGQGVRNDLEEIKNILDKEKSLLPVFEEHFSDACRYYKGFEKYMQVKLSTPRTWPMEVNVLYGGPGSGKSRYVYDKYGAVNIYTPIVTDTKIWWDNYKGQDVILFDDVRKLPIAEILKICDRYPYIGEVKGSSVNLCSHIVYFTSNYEPHSWFSENLLDPSPNLAAFYRRVTNFIKFENIQEAPITEIRWNAPETSTAVAEVSKGNTVSLAKSVSRKDNKDEIINLVPIASKPLNSKLTEESEKISGLLAQLNLKHDV